MQSQGCLIGITPHSSAPTDTLPHRSGIAKRLASSGANVTNGGRNESALKKAVNELDQSKGQNHQ